jgi:nucleotide-binding universal stress UspA family protein
MRILCGTDLTDSGARALRAAIALASRLKADLAVLHVVEAARIAGVDENFIWSVKERAESLLRDQARRLKAEGGPTMEVQIAVGSADDRILHAAAEADLIVVAGSGRHAEGRPWIGSTVERLVLGARAPVLVVRASEPFEAWASRERPLRVVAGADFSSSSLAAVRWACELRKAGPCDLTFVHAYHSAVERARLGLGGPIYGLDPSAEAENLLRRDLEARFGPIPGDGAVGWRFVAGLGAAAEPLLAEARALSADVLLAGTHQRRAAGRWWYGSVSRRLLEDAPCAVACVPAAALPDTGGIPVFRRVVAPTDLSETGDRALRYACALVPHGGVVSLVYVLEVELDRVRGVPRDGKFVAATAAPAERQQIASQVARLLEARVPAGAAERGIEVRIEVVEAPSAAEGIRRTAARLGADAIVMGSHGRSGVAAAVMGSVTRDVMAKSSVPVLAVAPPEVK